jgi:N-acylglucosamine-6-phosphate 2-epimerase
MVYPRATTATVLDRGLIVSCQAPVGSPLHDPLVIAAMAMAAVDQGAVGLRIDSPAHIAAVKARLAQTQTPAVPVIGLWKRGGAEVYITPGFAEAAAIAQADVIAVDGTARDRPSGETLPQLIHRIHGELGKPVMADIDTLDSALYAIEAGADIIGTTLFGYTAATRHCAPPGFALLETLVQQLPVPILCEGGVATPAQARHALDLGAYAVVVGTAITGIDAQVHRFCTAMASTTAPPD